MIFIYFHIYQVNNYLDIVNEIFTAINEFGLSNKTKAIIPIVIPENQGSEFITLSSIEFLSRNMKHNAKILYIHTKGVTTPNNECVNDWRRYMIWGCIENWEACTELLETSDTVGVDFEEQPTRHYSGNFWWANSDYIKTLPTIKSLIDMPEKDCILTKRHNAEFWIGMSNKDQINHFSLHDSKIPVMKRHLFRLHREQYAD